MNNTKKQSSGSFFNLFRINKRSPAPSNLPSISILPSPLITSRKFADLPKIITNKVSHSDLESQSKNNSLENFDSARSIDKTKSPYLPSNAGNYENKGNKKTSFFRGNHFLSRHHKEYFYLSSCYWHRRVWKGGVDLSVLS